MNLVVKMSKERYTSEGAYRIEREGESSLTEFASEYKPVESSSTPTGSSDDGKGQAYLTSCPGARITQLFSYAAECQF